jgi:putative FmdB family regulatory protein
MPIYEYECSKCGAHTEIFVKPGEKSPGKCGRCGGRLKKIISRSGFQFKGSGWYVTDYAKKKKDKGDGAAEKPAEKAPEKPADTAPAPKDKKKKD